MTRETLYALAAVFGATLAGIILGLVFIAIASIAYSLHYGAC
jgi:tetrahydromethanopterin S-methyltransferase subunit B